MRNTSFPKRHIIKTAMPTSVQDLYSQALTRGDILPDPAQELLIIQLDSLAQRLAGYRLPSKTGVLVRLFLSPQPRGLYIHGAVGRGKSYLMNMFFAAVPVQAKRRVHFHSFMSDVHARIHAWRQNRQRAGIPAADPLPVLAHTLAQEAAVLCFDEFVVTDVADAMILARLFSALFDKGVVVVATSNFAPQDLYYGGLNRSLFLPFIHVLNARMDVYHLDAPQDYRWQKSADDATYYSPHDRIADQALDAAFFSLTGAHEGGRVELRHKGHTLVVPQAVGKVARFDFDTLCRCAWSASDYLALTAAFPTIILDHIPLMSEDAPDSTKRFILFIDAAYEANTQLIISAQAEPHVLGRKLSGNTSAEFQRTASRLMEMKSRRYDKRD